jgi:two-component system OmpR family response regulator
MFLLNGGRRYSRLIPSQLSNAIARTSGLHPADRSRGDLPAPSGAKPPQSDPSLVTERPLDILIVDDEGSLREPLAQYLNRNWCRVTQAANATEARRTLSTQDFDLVVLDIMMPGEDGLSLCRYICERLDIPVILLTARADDADRIVGLEIGADDYVVKPFNPRELLARARAVIRRARALPPSMRVVNARTIRFGDWLLKPAHRELVASDGVVVPLTSREFKLLLIFLARPKIVLSREQLLDLAHGREALPFDRTIDNQVSRLRRKLESDIKKPRYIRTVWGGGYTFIAEVGLS